MSPGQMMPGQILPGQMSLWQLESVLDVPRNSPLRFHKNRVSNSWDIPDMNKCHLDKCCLEKFHRDSWSWDWQYCLRLEQLNVLWFFLGHSDINRYLPILFSKDQYIPILIYKNNIIVWLHHLCALRGVQQTFPFVKQYYPFLSSVDQLNIC